MPPASGISFTPIITLICCRFHIAAAAVAIWLKLSRGISWIRRGYIRSWAADLKIHDICMGEHFQETDWLLLEKDIFLDPDIVENAIVINGVCVLLDTVYLGPIQNCQHLNECTRYTLSQIPHQNLYTSTFFKWIFCHENYNKWQWPLRLLREYVLCTWFILIRLTIMDTDTLRFNVMTVIMLTLPNMHVAAVLLIKGIKDSNQLKSWRYGVDISGWQNCYFISKIKIKTEIIKLVIVNIGLKLLFQSIRTNLIFKQLPSWTALLSLSSDWFMF